jgi:hypothetical protein
LKAQMPMQAFRKTYPRALLAALQCDFDESKSNWVALLGDLNRGRTHHAIGHDFMEGEHSRSRFRHAGDGNQIILVLVTGAGTFWPNGLGMA